MVSLFFLVIVPVSGFLGTLIGYIIVNFHGVKSNQWFILTVFGIYMIISIGYLIKKILQAKRKSIHYR